MAKQVEENFVNIIKKRNDEKAHNEATSQVAYVKYILLPPRNIRITHNLNKIKQWNQHSLLRETKYKNITIVQKTETSHKTAS